MQKEHQIHAGRQVARPRRRHTFSWVNPVAAMRLPMCPGWRWVTARLLRAPGPWWSGQGPVRTGITAIFPLGRERGTGPVYAGFFSMSGNGEMSGAHLIEERGRFEGPITITNTHSCGLARDVTAQWLTSQVDTELRPEPFWMPVAGETYDGGLTM